MYDSLCQTETIFIEYTTESYIWAHIYLRTAMDLDLNEKNKFQISTLASQKLTFGQENPPTTSEG